MNYLNQVPATPGVGESLCASWEDSAGPGGSQRPRAEPAGCLALALAPVPLGHAPMAGYLLPLYQREGRPVPHLSSHLFPPCAPWPPPCRSQPICSSPAPAAGHMQGAAILHGFTLS